MHEAQLSLVTWRTDNLTAADRRAADDSAGRLFAQFRGRLRARRPRRR
jgi:hypothetical protein